VTSCARLSGIDDAGMAAGGDHDQPAIAQAEAGRVLVPVLVGLRLAAELVLGEMVVHVGVCVAAQAILDAAGRRRNTSAREYLHMAVASISNDSAIPGHDWHTQVARACHDQPVCGVSVQLAG